MTAVELLQQAVLAALRENMTRNDISTVVARTIANVQCGKISTESGD